jgi:hypothetical protein
MLQAKINHTVVKKYKNNSSVKSVSIRIMLVVAFFFAVNALCAQTEEPISENLWGEAYFQPQRFDGTPYLFDNWSNCEVRLKNGKVAEQVKVKFNILTNDLVFYNNAFKRLFKIDKNTVDAFILRPDEPDSLSFFLYKGSYQSLRIQNNDFIEVLHQGKIALWAKHTAEITTTNEMNSRDKIFPKDYYFLVTDEGIVDVSLRVKSLVKALPGYKKEIKALAKEHRIKNKSAKSMAKLIGLLNENL